MKPPGCKYMGINSSMLSHSCSMKIRMRLVSYCLAAGFLQQFAAVTDDARPHLHPAKALAQAMSRIGSQQALPYSKLIFNALAAGFLQQFAAVTDDARSHLHLAKALAALSGGRQPNRVLCTGHSLGGALATLGTQVCLSPQCWCAPNVLQCQML